jgi:hypothetical protein
MLGGYVIPNICFKVMLKRFFTNIWNWLNLIIALNDTWNLSILFAIVLDMQFNIFKIAMKSNIVVAMEVPFHVNPLTQLWWTLEASWILRHSLLKFLKLREIAIVQVLRLMEDERTFFTFSYMKSRLKNCLNEHLHIIVKHSTLWTPSCMMLDFIIRRTKNLGELWIKFQHSI